MNHFPKATTNPFLFRAEGEGTEEMSSWLRTLDALQEEPSSVIRPTWGSSQPSITGAPRRSYTSDLHGHCIHMYLSIFRHTHIHTI